MTTHRMTRVAAAADGTEAWECPVCGRRVILRWPPHYQRIVIARGDETVAHASGLGGVTMTMDVCEAPTAADLAWLADTGIDWS
jgi:hypothetical protein